MDSFCNTIIIVWKTEIIKMPNVLKKEKQIAFIAAYQTDNGRRIMAVLEVPPVDSPLNAVRAAIVSDAKKVNK